MRVHVRNCTECYPAFYTDECPDTGYYASTHDARPEFIGTDQCTFWGTPFHALMIGINNYEKYNWKSTSCKDYLKILRHIKEVNPAVNALHTEPVDTVEVKCFSLSQPGVESTVVMTKEEYEQHEHESWVYWCYMNEQNKL